MASCSAGDEASRHEQDAELERAYLRGKTFAGHGREVLSLIVESYIVPFLMVLPALLLVTFDTFERYDIFTVKMDSASGLNDRMEFFRISFLASLLYGAYLTVLIAIETLPPLLIWCIETVTGAISYGARRQMHHLRGVRSHLALLAVQAVFVVAGMVFLYQTAFFTPTGRGAGATAMASGSVLVERFLVALLLYLVCNAFAKYTIEVTSYGLHTRAFARRIHESNFAFAAINRLFACLSRGIEPNALPVRLHEAAVGRRSLVVRLLGDTSGVTLTSTGRAYDLAEVLYSKLGGEGASKDSSAAGFTIDALRPLFNASEVEDVHRLFDEAGTGGPVSRRAFTEAILSIYEERINIGRAMKYNAKVVSKLAAVLDLVAVTLSTIIGVALFNLLETVLIAIYLIVYSSFNFVIMEAVSGMCDALQFLFLTHAFDYGDRVVINGESLIVDRMDVQSTAFRRADGTLVYMRNGDLGASKGIYNMRRSGRTSDVVTFRVPLDTPTDRIWQWRDRMAAWAASLPAECTGDVSLARLDFCPGRAMAIGLQIEYVGNLQSVSKMKRRRERAERAAAEALGDLQIEPIGALSGAPDRKAVGPPSGA